MEEKKIIFERISKVLCLFGFLFFIAYFVVRSYVFYRGGEAEVYGANSFPPELTLFVIVFSTIVVFAGMILGMINNKYVKTEQT